MDAWRLSKDAGIWFDLLVKHCFPSPDSVGGLSTRLKQWKMVANSPDPSVVPATYRLDAERFGREALRAYCGHDPALWRQLRKAARRGPLPLDLTCIALLGYRQLWIEHAVRPTRKQLRTRVQLIMQQRHVGDTGAFDKRTWERVLKNIRSLFA
jgi:hypothetical protein